MITLKISLTLVDPRPRPALPPGVHTIAEIMPHVLAAHGLSLDQEPDSEQSAVAIRAEELVDIMIAAIELALAT